MPTIRTSTAIDASPNELPGVLGDTSATPRNLYWGSILRMTYSPFSYPNVYASGFLDTDGRTALLRSSNVSRTSTSPGRGTEVAVGAGLGVAVGIGVGVVAASLC